VPSRVARTVGRYEILDELGRGGMATVYLARQVDLDRLVALKELSALRQSDATFARRFLRESRLAGSLSHPNIVTVHDYLERDGVPYIAMEYVSGGSLRPHVGHLSLSQIAGVLEGVLAALDHAHSRHVVHRDLKPENVMVTADGGVKLTDFGIAKATGAAQTSSFLTRVGSTVGTPSYMAPEQAMGQEVGPSTDLYSVGVMAFELVVGHVPFHDTEDPMSILLRQVSDPVPPAASVDPGVDPRISSWIEALLVKEPTDRLGSASEAWDEFEEIVLGLVGPRWRRGARLAMTSDTARAVTPPTRPVGRARIVSTASETPTHRVTGGDGTPTRRVTGGDGAAFAPTVAPRRPRAPADGADPAPRRGGRGRGAILRRAAVLALAVLAIVAAVAHRSGTPDPTSATDRPPPARAGGGSDGPGPGVARPVPGATPVRGSRPVNGADLIVGVPPGWTRVARAADLGLPLSGAVAVAPGGRPSGPTVAFGVMRGATAENATLLPAAVVRATGRPAGTPPPRTAVRLPAHGLQAWRYRDLPATSGERTLTVYAVPTTDGVATVACATPPAEAAGFAQTCDRVAATLRLRSARAYPVGPSSTYAATLNAAIGGLQQAVGGDEADLAAAKTLSGQAGAARVLAIDYQAAAAQLAGLDLSPADRGVDRGLVGALRRVARAYRAAAGAATGATPARYQAASADVAAAKGRLNLALAGVRAAGYEPATAAARPPASSPPRGGDRPRTTTKRHHAAPQRDVGDSASDDPSDDSADP
jgi:protein kinase-like protein